VVVFSLYANVLFVLMFGGNTGIFLFTINLYCPVNLSTYLLEIDRKLAIELVSTGGKEEYSEYSNCFYHDYHDHKQQDIVT
jgi:hypothetical protein